MIGLARALNRSPSKERNSIVDLSFRWVMRLPAGVVCGKCSSCFSIHDDQMSADDRIIVALLFVEDYWTTCEERGCLIAQVLDCAGA